MFDAEKHRFGMAYKIRGGNVAYPVFRTALGKYKACLGKDITMLVYPVNLTRAPEHDLIPKAKADKLAAALRSMIDEFGHMIDIEGSEELNNAQQALAEYEGVNE